MHAANNSNTEDVHQGLGGASSPQGTHTHKHTQNACSKPVSIADLGATTLAALNLNFCLGSELTPPTASDQ